MSDIMKTVSPSQLLRHLVYSVKANNPAFVWGSPGIGKSDIARAVAKLCGFHLEDIRLSQMDSIDLRGLPVKGEGENGEAEVTWAKPDFLVRAERVRAESGKPTLFFLDEMNQAFPSTQAAAYQLVLDRQIGCFKLHPEDRIIAAGNMESDGGVTTQMATPLANRLAHYYLEVNADEWLSWATASNIHPYIIATIEKDKTQLHQFSDKERNGEEKAFGTPRSWAKGSSYLYEIEKLHNNFDSEFSGLDEEEFFIQKSFELNNTEEAILYDMELAMASCVGAGLARQFIAFVKTSFNLPQPDDIFSATVKEFDFENDKSREYLIINSCLHNLSIEHKKLKEYKEENDDSIKDPSDKYKIMLDDFYTKLENYIWFIDNNISEELCVYSIKTKMVDQLKIQPHPDYITSECFETVMNHFKRCRKEALEEETLNQKEEIEEVI